MDLTTEEGIVSGPPPPLPTLLLWQVSHYVVDSLLVPGVFIDSQ